MKILFLLIAFIFISFLSTTIRTIDAQFDPKLECNEKWSDRSLKIAIALPDRWLKHSTPTETIFYPPENSNVFISVKYYFPQPNTVFPSINTPVKEVAEGAIKANMQNTPNFELVEINNYPGNSQYIISYSYDKNGVRTFEIGNFGIDNNRLYVVTSSIPSSLLGGEYNTGIACAGTFIFGSKWDELIGTTYDGSSTYDKKLEELRNINEEYKIKSEQIKSEHCAKMNIIGNMRSGPTTEKYWDSYCEVWRYR